MATSTVVFASSQRYKSPSAGSNISLLTLYLLFTFTIITSAISISSTDDISDVPDSEEAFVLLLNESTLYDEKIYSVAPLTFAAGKHQNSVAISTFEIRGNINLVRSTADNVSDSDMAFISCDTENELNNSSDLLVFAADKKPQAIVLYSKDKEACTYTNDNGYQSVYSMISKRESLELVTIFNSDPALLQAMISSNSSEALDATKDNVSTQGGPAPTTAVAMSILYSITGIITVLFLIIIATGAIRAHRHPERYGMRNTGMPGQSRAKGLARAILDTIPIVKYGGTATDKMETELEAGNRDLKGNNVTNEIAIEKPQILMPTSKALEQDKYAIKAENLGCSICTEDFLIGEDLRVLPCHHQYHPACIDPWLLNVSGTCPLWYSHPPYNRVALIIFSRYDLRPNTTLASSEGASEGYELPPPLSAIEDNSHSSDYDVANRHRYTIARFLDRNRLRHAPPDERIAALRQLRHHSRAEAGQTTTEDAEERIRSVSLAQRLKDAFRITTRTQSVTTLPST
ncbi:RING finger domain protein [Blumeria hordei DH14]|uniref:RING finger domain protein n=1 Tax=Blumeria graminis f. sp. hordei (strain DH14) TaxID=546991 RepID=N1JP00_BLUG1|nr:RING finger domain protein [Blumeria hordei DH14]